MDTQGSPIPQVVPSACLLDTPTTFSVGGESSVAPAWRGEPADCKSSGWQELGFVLAPSSSQAARDFPERKWFIGIAEHAGYVILRLRYFPAWAVKVNGIPATGLAEQERGLMAVPVPKGNVNITVEWTTTGDVVAGRCVSGMAVLLIIALLRFERTRLKASRDLSDPNSLGSPEDSRLRNGESTHPAPSLRMASGKTSLVQPKQNARRTVARKPKAGK